MVPLFLMYSPQGRPQFGESLPSSLVSKMDPFLPFITDREGVAIIMCEQELEHKYRNLAQGTTVLESSLHENLLEHVNSEIGIGAISDLQSAKDWLRNSFLRQRIQKNPGHYHIGKTAAQTWEEKMDDMVLQAVEKLQKNELIYSGGKDKSALHVTEYGDLMSKVRLSAWQAGSLVRAEPDCHIVLHPTIHGEQRRWSTWRA